MSSLDWGILIVAGASLIFAFLAFRKVGVATDEVHEFTERGHRLLDGAGEAGKTILDPGFIADVASRMITGGQKLPDGSPVQVTDIMTGYINVYGRAVYADIKKEIPSYIPIIMQYSGPSPPTGPQSPGQALAAQRWGGGGLELAKRAGKIASKAGAGGWAEKIRAGGEIVGALAEVKPLINDIKGLLGKGGDGGNGQDSSAPAHEGSGGGSSDWRPPC